MAENTVARHAATRVGTGVQTPARINQAEEAVVVPYEWQLGLEGRLFIAGHGIEETATNSEASLDDTTPSFALVAPTSAVVCVPLWLEVRMHGEGGNTPELYAAYVQADKGVADNGTAITSLNLLGGTNTGSTAARSATGQVRHTLSSVTAITDAQNVLLTRRANILDNLISAEMVATDSNIQTVDRSVLAWEWKVPFPILLRSGSSLLVYLNTATSDSTWTFSVVWAELDADTYVV